MTVFADTSSLVKLYAVEPGSDAVAALDEPLVVSQLARVEVVAALWRKERSRELTADAARVLNDAFDDDWTDDRFIVVDVSGELLEDAARLIAVHGLRAYDGVQLASAVRARTVEPSIDEFAAFDAELAGAAAAEGFRPVPA